MLLNSTKKQLLDIVRQRLDPTLFEGVDEERRSGSVAFVIRLKGTALEFIVNHAPNSYRELNCQFVTFSPTNWRSDLRPYNGFSSDFTVIQSTLEEWLLYHVVPYLEDVAIPNPWEALTQERLLFESASLQPGDLDPFKGDEKEAMRKAIAEFERRIHASFLPDAKQAEAIAAQLKYLSGAVDRLNHFDWRSLLLSTVIGISTTLSLDTETGRQLFEIAKQIFAGALKYLPG